ncbi:MAG: aldo/keto reductase, partial [Nostoc sp.]
RYWRDREFNTVEELSTVADLAGLSLTTLAVAWVLANPIITAPIIGASRPEQLVDTLKAVELKLDDSLKQKLDHITAEYRRGDSLR